jgi:serine/threonine-protein kinase
VAVHDVAQLTTLSEEGLLETLGIDTDRFERANVTFQADPNATLDPNRTPDPALLRAIDALAQTSAARSLSSGLTLGRTIGEGGMGIVHLAVQESLGREVAVKTLKNSAASQLATSRLVREAWVTGTLEHPNVVPVYDLALDQAGLPIIVLRRISGLRWDELMHEPVEIKRRFGNNDPLEWNLRILIRLIDAVSLAHDRGIIHRDLKPDNVMIGNFGEVYVLDWGVAVSVRQDPTGHMPTKTSDVCGTPAYMAPEMFGGLDATISERSDVYLLGGILHEILTGHPPHRGGSLRAMLLSALASKFQFPESAPALLIAIAERALSANPADRFESAIELQKKLEWYLRHRGSLALSDEAGERLNELRVMIASPDEDLADLRDRVHHLFAECRFGFRAALRASDDNADAKAGLRAVSSLVARFELDHGSPEAAAAALAELSDAPPELTQAVAQALGRQADERRNAERLRKDLDVGVGRRTRLFLSVLFGVLWSSGPLVAMALEHSWAAPYVASPKIYVRVLYGWTLLFTLTCALLGWWARVSMGASRLNRQVLAAVLVLGSTQLALQLGGDLLGLNYETLLALHPFLWFTIVAMATVGIERRLWPASLGFASAFLITCLAPSWRWIAMSLSNAALAINMVAAWRPEIRDRHELVEFLSANVRERRAGSGSK